MSLHQCSDQRLHLVHAIDDDRAAVLAGATHYVVDATGECASFGLTMRFAAEHRAQVVFHRICDEIVHGYGDRERAAD